MTHATRRAFLLATAGLTLAGCASGGGPVTPPTGTPSREPLPPIECGQGGVRSLPGDVRPRDPRDWLEPDLAFSGDGKEVCAPTTTGWVIWSTETGKILRRAPFAPGDGWRVSWNPKRPMLAVPSCAAQAKLLKADDFSEVGKLTGHKEVDTSEGPMGLRQTWFAPEGKTIFSSANDGKFKLWDVDSRAELWSGEAGTPAPATLAFAPDGRHMVEADWNKEPAVWDLEQMKVVSRIEGVGTVPYPSFSPDGSSLLAPDLSWNLFFIDPKTFKVTEKKTHGDLGFKPESAVWTADGKHLALLNDNQLAVWEVGGGKAKELPLGFTHGYRRLTLWPSAQSDRFFIADERAGIFCRDLTSTEPLFSFEKPA